MAIEASIQRDPISRATVSVRRPKSHRPVMSVIVNAWNTSNSLHHSVDSIRLAATACRTEIIVVSNKNWLDAPPGIRVVHDDRASRGERLDRAAEFATGKYIAFIDAGAELGPGWQARALELLADPKIGAVGGPVLAPKDLLPAQRASTLVLGSPLGTGPRRYQFSDGKRRPAAELAAGNIVVRADDFHQVGGFQCPTPLADATRLCFKLRSLRHLKIVSDPDLAVTRTPPTSPSPFLRLVYNRGLHRGDLSRRLPEASPALPSGLPAVALLTMAVLAAGAIISPIARLILGAVFLLYLLEGLRLMVRAGDLRTGAIAALTLPLTPTFHGLGFIRGYLGRSLGEVSPGRHQGPLRILIFNWRDTTHPWSGGAESYMHQVARRWVAAGCEVGWVCERYRRGRRFEVIDGISFHRVGGQVTVYPLAALAYLFRLRKHYDVIVDCENGIPFFTPLYSRKPTVLTIYHVHQEVFRTQLPGYLRWLALWLEADLMPWLYRHKQLVTISRSTRDELLKHGFKPDSIEIVTPGVTPPQAKPGGTRRSRHPRIVYLGRLKPYKSVDVLIRAMPRVLERFPTAVLSVIGQGPDRSRLERLSWSLGLARHVRFHGFMGNAARDQLLAQSWVSVAPSLFEGWGISCMESNSWGIPVIASDVAGLRDSVKRDVTGTLFPYGNSEVLGDQLCDLISDPRRRRRMGEAGIRWAGEHSWDQSAEQYLKVLASLAVASPSAAETTAQAH